MWRIIERPLDASKAAVPIPKNKSFGYEKKEIREWEQEDIGEWLESLGFGDVKEKFFEHCEGGEELLEMEEGVDMEYELAELIQDPVKVRLLLLYYKYLRFCANYDLTEDEEIPFNLDFQSTAEKFLKRYKEDELEDLDLDEICIHCAILCDSKKISQYLFDNDDDMEEDEGEDDDDDDDDMVDDDTDDDEKMKLRIIPTDINLNFTEDVEFLEKESYSQQTEVEHRFRPKFGELHYVVWVGEFLLQWTPNEFCIPMKLDYKEEECPLVVKMLNDSYPIELDIPYKRGKVLKILSKFVQKWNSHFRFTLANSLWKMLSNEGLFVEQVMDFLGLKESVLEDVMPCLTEKEKEGPYYKFYQKMKEKGRSTISIKLTKDFIDAYNVTKYPNLGKITKESKSEPSSTKLVFETHESLDKFVDWCYHQNIVHYCSEFKLLKAFDRVFWIRHHLEPDNDAYKPACINHNRQNWMKKYGKNKLYYSGCPFMNPKDGIVEPEGEEKERLEKMQEEWKKKSEGEEEEIQDLPSVEESADVDGDGYLE